MTLQIGHGLPQAPPANSIPVFTAVIVIVSLGSFVVTVQTKVSTLQPQYSANADPSCSSLGVKCASSCFPYAYDADQNIDRSSRDFASWGTVSPPLMSPLWWPCSSRRFTSGHRFLSPLGHGVYGVGDILSRETWSDNFRPSSRCELSFGVEN